MSDKVVIEPPFSYIEGVKPVVAKKIEDMLKKGRRYFGSSGAGMTHLASSPDYDEKENLNRELAKDNLEAEREITEFLQTWIKDKPGVVLIDALWIPDWEKDDSIEDPDLGLFEIGDTDHVLLIGDEILLIDTKRWKKKKNYSVDDDGSALMTNKPFPDNKITMMEGVYMWLDYFENEEASITGIVCIKNEETTVLRNKNWFTNPYRLVEFDRFEELLNKKWDEIDEEDRVRINTTTVAQCVVRCIKPFDSYTRVFSDMNQLRDFK